MKTQNETVKFVHDQAIAQIIKDAELNGRVLTLKAIHYAINSNSNMGKQIMKRYAEYVTIAYEVIGEVA